MVYICLWLMTHLLKLVVLINLGKKKRILVNINSTDTDYTSTWHLLITKNATSGTDANVPLRCYTQRSFNTNKLLSEVETWSLFSFRTCEFSYCVWILIWFQTLKITLLLRTRENFRIQRKAAGVIIKWSSFKIMIR